MKRSISLFISFFTLALGLQFVQAATLEETFKKRLDASDYSNIIVQNVNGSISVSSWTNDEIEIVANKKVRADNMERARRLMDALKIDISDDGKSLLVETKLPRNRKGRNNGFFTWLFNGGNSGTSISYEIRVPKQMDMEIRSTNGSVTVNDCSGDIMLSTTNGKIRAEEMAGALRVRSTNGSLNISMRKVDKKEMSFKTTNGSIKLYLPFKTEADIEARTTNGKIRCELPLSESYEKSKRRLEGELNNGGSLIYLKTTNGSISILEY